MYSCAIEVVEYDVIYLFQIVGDLLHERLILSALSSVSTVTSSLTEVQFLDELHARMSPLYQFLRELARWTRSEGSSQLNPSNSVGTAQTGSNATQQHYLPCAELALALLQDRSFRGSATASTVCNAVAVSLTQPREHTSSGAPTSEASARLYLFRFYLNGLIALVSVLQMISANRPFLASPQNARRTSK